MISRASRKQSVLAILGGLHEKTTFRKPFLQEGRSLLLIFNDQNSHANLDKVEPPRESSQEEEGKKRLLRSVFK